MYIEIIDLLLIEIFVYYKIYEEEVLIVSFIFLF